MDKLINKLIEGLFSNISNTFRVYYKEPPQLYGDPTRWYKQFGLKYTDIVKSLNKTSNCIGINPSQLPLINQVSDNVKLDNNNYNKIQDENKDILCIGYATINNNDVYLMSSTKIPNDVVLIGYTNPLSNSKSYLEWLTQNVYGYILIL